LNPSPENQLPLPGTPESPATGDAISTLPPTPAPPRDPVWTGLDVLRILLIGAVILFATILATAVVVPGPTFRERMLRLSASPILLIVAQMFAYVLLLGYMVILVKRERRSPRFWRAIHWNWPRTIWPYVVIGLVMQIALLGMERFLPLPKQTPFDVLLRNPSTVLLIAVFAITLGPLMEELFFRGFFYPVLARRFGMVAGVAVSAFGFGLVHAAQYGYSWASVLLITLVGIVLGAVRAVKDSVAAGFLVHAAYNSTIILMIVIASDGLRHLEKLTSP
jgi:membrane protease YdiL (CAAX protease family)